MASNKINALTLKNFTAFESTEFAFSDSINVMIGTNGTGKTHILKIVYAILKSIQTAHSKRRMTIRQFENVLYFKLEAVFRFVEDVSILIRARSYRGLSHHNGQLRYQQGVCEIGLTVDSRPFDLHICSEMGGLGYFEWPLFQVEDTELDQERAPLPIEQFPKLQSIVYLPAQEFLAIHEGFIAAYTNRESAFDETYYDLSVALNARPLRMNAIDSRLKPVIDLIRMFIAGEGAADKEILSQENGRFYFDLPEGHLDGHLVADGYRKLATLLYLLRNGSLQHNSILLWDEPEANLNPTLIVKVAQIIKMLAAAGMQIFVTTHDFLLSQELSLDQEYPSAHNQPNVRFFALHKSSRMAGVEVESSETLSDVQNNAILDEFVAHHDREEHLILQVG